MTSFNVTRRALSLGTRDSITGWAAKSYTTTTIKGTFDPANIRMLNLPVGSFTGSGRPFLTANYVRAGDQIVHSVLGTFTLTSAKKVVVGDEFVYYACTAEEVFNPSDRASTSGTWHTDSESVKTDPKNRLKVWVDTYISYGAATDNTVFAGLDYPLEYEFTDLSTGVLCAIDVAPAAAEYTWNHYPYKFNETVNLHIYAMDTTSLTAVNILESYEQAIRKVATDHPIGSIRKIESTKPEKTDVGGHKYLWSQTITIKYTRYNDDMSAGSGITITWGPSTSATGTYTWPNITRFKLRDPSNGDVRMYIPSRSGDLLQILGARDYEIILESDTAMEPVLKTFKRPQASTPKTDTEPWQVFNEIKFDGETDSTRIYQTFNYGGGSTIPVRITNVDIDNDLLVVTLKRYTSADASASTYNVWYGLS